MKVEKLAKNWQMVQNSQPLSPENDAARVYAWNWNRDRLRNERESGVRVSEVDEMNFIANDELLTQKD